MEWISVTSMLGSLDPNIARRPWRNLNHSQAHSAQLAVGVLSRQDIELLVGMMSSSLCSLAKILNECYVDSCSLRP